jgi:hypothetical protein
MKTKGKTIKNKYNFRNLYLPVIPFLILGLLLSFSVPVLAQTGSATSTVTVSNDAPTVGEQITATISIDMSGVISPDNALGSFTASIGWNPAVLSYNTNSGILAGFTGVVNVGNAGTGSIAFNGANASGTTGNFIVLNITFNVIGTGTSTLDLAYSAMSTTTFKDPLSILTVNDASVLASGSGSGSITFVGNIGSVSNNNGGTSLQIPVGASGVAVGNTIIVGFASRGATTYNQPTVSDAGGNTYYMASVAVTYSHGRSYIFYAHVDHALTNGQSITITTSSVSSRVAVASVFSGLASANLLDQAIGNPTLEAQSTQQGNNPTVGPTGTTTQPNELVVGMIGTEEATDAGVGTWLNSFTAGPQIKTSGATNEWRVSMGYRIVSSTGAYTAAKTVTNNPYWAAAIATFKTQDILSITEYNVLLNRPTNNSINASTIMTMAGDIYFEYGTSPDNYSAGQTGSVAVTANVPVNVLISGLNTDTKYYYRLRFKATGSSTWIPGAEDSFHTDRAKDETFTFTITSDSHLGETFSGNTEARYSQTMANVALDHSDFHIDLGDSFLMEDASNQTEANNIYSAQRPYFSNFSNSTPVFIAIGNHENEEGWNFDDTPVSKAFISMIARKQYFPNPIPGGFYSGNSDLLNAIGGDKYREDYYSFEWGDALIIVLDPFQYTMTIPYSNVTGSGQDNDETASGDQWNWTLGQQQYNWFKQTLQNSTAKYKFVFSHHVLGGQLEVSNAAAGPPTYVRGGAMAANYFEWGGKNANGTDGFSTNRPGWGDPIHKLMVDNGVTAYFHGHDHQFVHEKIDGIAYQLVPSAGMTGYGFDLYDESGYVQTENGILGNLSNSGHLRVTVSSNLATVEYVRSNESNGQVVYSYTLSPNATVEPAINVTSPNGGEDWQVGSIHNITWTSSGLTGGVHLEYSINDGVSWIDIVESTPNTGSYSWTIPNNPSGTCKARVVDTDGTPSDISDAVFTISVPSGTHFVPDWTGNGMDHMNFYALTATLDGTDLQPGDEIGIFDGTNCVGSGVLTQVLNGAIYLEIRVSRDDPATGETDGYTVGHTATFKIWDASALKEITAVQITYETGSNDIFDIGASSWYHIAGLSVVDQVINLTQNWNIFSLYVTPGNPDMLQVLKPLIDGGYLVKVQNEAGAALEQIPGTSTWVNNIGNWSNTEGYKIKVNASTPLTVTGMPITNPVDIDLLTGWNIISYPVSFSQDAMTLLNGLIGADRLIKVQDQAGSAIELIPGTSTWINNIGNFDPDEGYKVKVTEDGPLTINPAGSGAKGLSVSGQTNVPLQYYKPVYNGNGLDQMNFYLFEKTSESSGLKPGDEIGVFDGSICVGAMVVKEAGEKFYSFVASADDPTTREIDGFIKGHTPTFRVWRPSTNSETFIKTFDYYPGSDKLFGPMNTAALKINSSLLNFKSEIDLTTSLGDNYPNPFTHETTINFTIGIESAVDIGIYNVMGKRLGTIVHANYQSGSYKVVWNATNDNNSKVPTGIYFCKMIAGEKVFVKKLIVKK